MTFLTSSKNKDQYLSFLTCNKNNQAVPIIVYVIKK